MAEPRAISRRPGQRGFSMVELMFALAVIAIALMGIFSVILHTMRTKEAMRELEYAKEAAAAKMEEIKAQDFDEIPTKYSSGSTGASFTVENLSNPSSTNPQQKGTGTVSIHPAADSELVDLTVAGPLLFVRASM